MIRPIFIVGSPRSGTSLLGNFIGSSPEVCNLGEYGGFYLTDFLVEQHFMAKMPSRFKAELISELQKATKGFAVKKAKQQGAKYFLDATPGNLLIANQLCKRFPRCIFILLLRHYSGVIQSLERSYNDGYSWAGSTLEERARIWTTYYAASVLLPPERTIIIGYDELCSNPANSIRGIYRKFQEFNIDASKFDLGQFCISHANGEKKGRKTLGYFKKGIVRFRRIPSFDWHSWSESTESAVSPIVSTIDAFLHQNFGDTYAIPKGFDR